MQALLAYSVEATKDATMKTAWRIFSYLKDYPGLAAAQLSCAILMTVMILVFPKTAQFIVSEIIENDTLETAIKYQKIIQYVGIVIVAFFARDFFNYLRIIINNVFEQRAIFDLRSNLYKKLQSMPLPWFDNRRTGDIMTRVAEDVPAMERLLIDGIEQGLVACIQITIVAVFLFYQDAWMALAALSPLPLLVMGALIYTKNSRDRYREVKQYTGDMNSVLNDNVAGIRQIKSFAAEKKEQQRFENAANKVKNATLKVMRAWAIYSPSMSFFNSLGYSAVLGVGAWRMVNGDINSGLFISFFTIIWALYEPVTRLHQLNQMAQSSITAAERVFQIMDSESEIHAESGKKITLPVQGHIAFKHVNFSYKKNDPSGEKTATIANVSLEAKTGQTIALVGTTGAGKSTLVNLLTRFYEYDSGSIEIDGQAINTLHKPSLRNEIGYVTQEPFLFNGTIKENLELAKRGASDQEMWQALKAANAAAFVEQFPEGIETQIGERGVKLSGGEKQRISIARALLKNPPILILDEATASVDSTTEHLIQKALDHLLEKRTAFVIAHRLSTIKNADCIHVLEKGQIIESGTHKELLKKKGKYAHLSEQSFLHEA